MRWRSACWVKQVLFRVVKKRAVIQIIFMLAWLCIVMIMIFVSKYGDAESIYYGAPVGAILNDRKFRRHPFPAFHANGNRGMIYGNPGLIQIVSNQIAFGRTAYPRAYPTIIQGNRNASSTYRAPSRIWDASPVIKSCLKIRIASSVSKLSLRHP